MTYRADEYQGVLFSAVTDKRPRIFPPIRISDFEGILGKFNFDITF